MADQNQSTTPGDRIRRAGKLIERLDLFADLATIVAIFFGLRPRDETRKIMEEKHKESGLHLWLLSVLYPLTESDERLRDQMLVNANTALHIPDFKNKIFRFTDKIKEHHWDPDHFRIIMICMYKEFLDSDKGMHCDQNTAFDILKDIALLDNDYDKQEYLAKHMGLLSKAGPIKKMFKWMHAHKLWTLVFLILIPAVLAKMIFHLFLTIFG